jgi:hypothetical protein
MVLPTWGQVSRSLVYEGAHAKAQGRNEVGSIRKRSSGYWALGIVHPYGLPSVFGHQITG